LNRSTEHEITPELDPLFRAIENNPEAFNELAARYRGQLYKQALLVLGNPEDAEDALQQGLLSAFGNLQRFKGRCKLSTWLNRIVINAALMQLRRRRSGVLSMNAKLNEGGQEEKFRIPDPGLNPEQVYERREQLQILGRSLRELAAPYRRVLWLRDIQGMTSKQAAAILGLSEGTLKSQLSRARLKLKKEITASHARRWPTSRRGVPMTRYFRSSRFTQSLAPAA
jgi:RNA polymerase sigma-70 factor (ECF subfamily)